MKRPGTLVLFATLIGGCTVLADISDENVVYEEEEACMPGKPRACYSGPAGTEEVGICKGGTQECNAEGTGFGPCEGEVTPAPESCVAQQDDDCDGETPVPEVECACVPSTEVKCDYTGPEGTEGIGLCAAGHRVCNALGTEYGPCMGETVPSAEKCSPKQDANCNGVPECEGTYVWSKAFGSMGQEIGFGVATDSEGNVVLTGALWEGTDFGNGPINSPGGTDTFVVKLGADGVQWSKYFGDLDFQGGTSVAIDNTGNIVLTGYFSSTIDFGGDLLTHKGNNDIFVAKFDAFGTHIWSKSFGSSVFDTGVSVATDSLGNVVLTGYFGDTLDFGGLQLTSTGSRNIFVAKFDATGNHLWSKRFGNMDAQEGEGTSVAIDSADNIVLTGYFEGTVDFGGVSFTSAGKDDIFVAKLDPDGNHLWSKPFGDGATQKGASVATDYAGNVILTGDFRSMVNLGGETFTSASETDVFVAKLNAKGEHLWSKHFGGLGFEEAASVATDNAGNIVLTGFFSYEIDFGNSTVHSSVGQSEDIFLVKLNPDGDLVWSKPFGDENIQKGRSVATDNAGNVVLTGSFHGKTNFNNIADSPLHSKGGEDIFVAKFSP